MKQSLVKKIFLPTAHPAKNGTYRDFFIKLKKFKKISETWSHMFAWTLSIRISLSYWFLYCILLNFLVIKFPTIYLETLLHILSNCSTSLDQGRYTWRHDSVLTSIITLIRPHLYDGMVLYSDMIGYQAPHGGTIPPHILVTNLRPDIFIVDENARIAIVFELTCPWDNNIERSHTYKEEKYSPLVADLANSFSVFHFSVEVSVRGQVTKNNRARLKSFVYRSCRDARPLTKSLTKIISKAALLSSFSLFNARKEPSWISPTPLVVRWSYLITFFLFMFQFLCGIIYCGFDMFLSTMF